MPQRFSPACRRFFGSWPRCLPGRRQNRSAPLSPPEPGSIPKWRGLSENGSGKRIHNFYGSSETGGICYDRTGDASLTGRSVGLPLKGVRITVKKGRLTVASAAVATRTGRWRPEDRGEWNSRNELVLTGRGGTGANIGGKKVHPLEVENLLRSLPGVTDATVWRHALASRDLLAAAVESTRTQKEIETALAARLPAWKCPKWLVVARHLPRTGRGKLDLASLRGRIKTAFP